MKTSKSTWKLYTSIAIFIVLASSYFITFTTDNGSNYVLEERLLGILIFHNPFVLALYILIAAVLFVKWKRT